MLPTLLVSVPVQPADDTSHSSIYLYHDRPYSTARYSIYTLYNTCIADFWSDWPYRPHLHENALQIAFILRKSRLLSHRALAHMNSISRELPGFPPFASLSASMVKAASVKFAYLPFARWFGHGGTVSARHLFNWCIATVKEYTTEVTEPVEATTLSIFACV